MVVTEHVLLIVFWVAWCVVHSVLIANGWMRLVGRLPDGVQRWYRLAYVVFSAASLAPVLLYQRSIAVDVYWTWHWPWLLLQWTGLAAAAVLFYAGARSYDQAVFFGIRQLQQGPTAPDAGLRYDGILAHVRHPYYGGGILVLLLWGDGDSATLVMRIVGILYLLVGTELEERKLLQQYGEAYQEYRKRVPKFFPLPRLFRK